MLAEKLAEGLPIQHETTISHIDWSGNGVKLQCSDGKVIQADAAIVTVSLGVLKVLMLYHCRISISTALKLHVCMNKVCQVMTRCFIQALALGL